MSKLVILIGISIFGFGQFGFAQVVPNESLEGHWIGTNILKVNGDSINIIGLRYKTTSELFFERATVTTERGEKVSFQIEGNILTLGNRLYFLEFLDSQKMILLEFDRQNPQDPFAKRIFYEKKKGSI